MTENQKSKIRTLRRKGYGYGRIAKELDIPLNTVKSYCRRNADEIAEKPKLVVEYTGEVTHCENCGKEFHLYGDSRRKYCSHECYIKDRFGGRGNGR